MRLLAVILSCLLAFPELASAQARPPLKVIVVEGEGGINDIALGSGQPIVVQVRDENDQPVVGANVNFLLPERGAGGRFYGTWRNMIVTTNEQGRATGNGFRPNLIEGEFRIAVTASQGDRTGAVNITQNNVLPGQTPGATTKAGNKFGSRKMMMLYGAAGVGAIIAAVLANRGNESSSSTIPGTSITPGTITVGNPR